jgi:hypothetical protein
MTSHLPVISQSVALEVSRDLKVAYESWMQDWPIEVADPARLEEFVVRCEAEERGSHRTAILAVVIASLDEACAKEKPPAALLSRISALLKRRSADVDSLVRYWCATSAKSSSEMFHVSSWLRTQ